LALIHFERPEDARLVAAATGSDNPKDRSASGRLMSGMGGSGQIGQFMPHGICYLWNGRLLALHVISDAVIALAYFSIPIILLFFVRKRSDLPFPGVFAMFGLFIVACGLTHVLEIWTIWHPAYWLSGSVKALTACVSFATAVLLMRVVPQALAIGGRADYYRQLAELNATLEQQVLVRTTKLLEGRLNLASSTSNYRRGRLRPSASPPPIR